MADLPPETVATELLKCSDRVGLWLGLNCPAHTIPRPEIAALVTWARTTVPSPEAIAADRALNAAPSVGAEGLPGFAAWWRDNFEAGTPQDASFAEAERCARVVWMAALASRPAVDAWQPIETAPKDGTRILIDFGTKGVLQVAWQDRDGDGFAIWCVDDEKFGPYPLRGYIDKPDSPTRPRAWMPTPAARHPAQREGE